MAAQPPPAAQPRGSRVVIYIDGFNLYYGVLRHSRVKWLDLEKLFRLLRPHDTIQKIRYFTALSSGGKSADQLAYLKAIETFPLVNIVHGRYKSKKIKCHVQHQACGVAKKDRFFIMQEEKRTDVNIAVTMLDDAYQQVGDHLILVSGDSDLVPAVNMVKTRFPNITISVYVPARDPTRGAAVELRSAADKNRSLPLDLLKKAQLPASIPDGPGGVITKPATW
jgi:6-hydroxy-3-succinoylpyridine 3-monooxygenase